MSTLNVKQVIVLRKFPNLRKGKYCAQTAHASMKVFFDKFMVEGKKVTFSLTDEELAWVVGRFTKICVSVDTEEQLLDVYQRAKERGLNCSLIQDAGLTEFGGVPTYTAVAIGPNEAEDIDVITGSLSLL